MAHQFHHHHHQQWRPRPPIPGPPASANLCPTCSYPHFPFCPPNPNSFSQFHHHHHHPPPPPYGHFPHHAAADVDQSHKRPRVDGENERRLKLVRDHGGPGSVPNWGYANGFDPNHNNHQIYSHSNYLPQISGNNHVQATPPYHGGHPQPPPLPSLPPPSLFPVGPASSIPTRGPQIPESGAAAAAAPPYFNSKSFIHSSSGFASQDMQGTRGMLPNQYIAEDQSSRQKHSPSEKPPTVVDASLLFKKPHRATRPDHFVIILRGLPGSGKSYLAKMLRDIEVENGCPAPRIHSMDDYFMMEVEKVEEDDVLKSSVSVRGKKPVVRKVMEYCYEAEMEEAYRSSMLKSFKKTLEDAAFTFIIVDDRNLRKADFAQFWAIAKSSGYEVYILEAAYKDPAGCAARNVHGFTLDNIQKMASQWEEAPPFHLRLDAKSLFSGDDLKKNGIQEVDMDLEDEDEDESSSDSHRRNTNTVASPAKDDDSPADDEGNTIEVKELGRSKWSNDLFENDSEQTRPTQDKVNALSGLIHVKEAKSVRWGDKGGIDGFSISAAKKAIMPSLVIGPGDGYNLKSNPLTEENGYISGNRSGESKKQTSVFQEQLRVERESFKAAFSKRQVRIGLDVDDE